MGLGPATLQEVSDSLHLNRYRSSGDYEASPMLMKLQTLPLLPSYHKLLYEKSSP